MALSASALAGQALVASASTVTKPAVAASWTTTRLPLPAGASTNSFMPLAISCSSATHCAGGGKYQGPSLHAEGALLNWSGKKWTATTAPVPADASANPHAAVLSMSCLSATRCFAGGDYLGTHGSRGMILTWSGTKWAAARAAVPAGAALNPDAAVSGMSCPSATWCTAVGLYADTASHTDGLLLRLSGKKWTATTAPVPAGAPGFAALNAVSCPSVTRCFAGGTHEDALFETQLLLLTWSGSKWTLVNVPLPAGAATDPQGDIYSVSCPPVTRCFGTGTYLDSAGNQQGVLLSWSGKKWTASKAPVPAGAASNPFTTLYAVSCASSTHCTAGGLYASATSASVGLLLTWSGKKWTAARAPTIAFALHGMSCPTTTRCVAVSGGIGRPVALTGP
jgi:hypothetical protein